MSTVTALSNINHDGDDYAKGDTIEVSAEQAKALIESGAAKKGRVTVDAEVIEDEVVVEDEVVNDDGLDGLGFDALKERAIADGIDVADLRSKDALREAIRAKAVDQPQD